MNLFGLGNAMVPEVCPCTLLSADTPVVRSLKYVLEKAYPPDCGTIRLVLILFCGGSTAVCCVVGHM